MTTNNKHEKNLAERLAAYRVVFEFLGRIYLQVPDRDFINSLVSENLFFDWPLLSEEPAMKKGIALLQAFSNNWEPAQIDDLKLDYTRLFIGFERTLASPFESVYLSKYHIMFEKQTLAVRRFYERFGLQAKKKQVEPDDHIGMELLFIAHLCSTAGPHPPAKKSLKVLIKLFQKFGPRQGRRRQEVTKEELKKFLTAHLLRWITPFLNKVSEHAQTDYFKGIAYLTRGAVNDMGHHMAGV